MVLLKLESEVNRFWRFPLKQLGNLFRPREEDAKKDK